MTDSAPKRPRWPYLLLFVSLAANLLVAGILAGWLISPGGPQRSDFGQARGLVGEPFLRALPDSERRAIMRDAIKEAPRIRESRESLRARVDAFLAAIRAEPYDPETVEILLKEQRDVALRRQDIGERLLLNRLEAMNSEQRAAYADALQRTLRRQSRFRD